MNLYLVRLPRPLGMSGRCYGRQDVAVSAESAAMVAARWRRWVVRLTASGVGTAVTGE